MFTRVPLVDGDVIFRRVANGWWVGRLETREDGTPRMVEFVFTEDDSIEEAASAALADALYEAFDGYFRSKWEGGLVVKFEKDGREVEAAFAEANEAFQSAVATNTDYVEPLDLDRVPDGIFEDLPHNEE